jgi:hypothetical protein
MNQYFYIDSLENSSDAILYKFKTDLTKDQLIDFIYKKARDYCNQNDIDIEEYFNYPEDSLYLELNINQSIYYLSLITCIDKELLNEKLIYKMNWQTIQIKLENII